MSCSISALMQSGGDVTEARWRKRRPAPERQALKTIETHVTSLAKEGTRVHIVAAGVLYGEGEESLAPLFKQAWLCETDAVTVPTADGKGVNCVPMIHVSDLAAALVALAKEEEETTYLLAVDDAHLSLAEVALAISRSLGLGRIYVPPKTEGEALLLAHPSLAELQVDLRLDMEEAALGRLPLPWRAKEGLAVHAAAVAAEYVTARALEPVRVVVHGAPMAGKSAVCAALAKEYFLNAITPQSAVQMLVRDPVALSGADTAQPPPGPVLVSEEDEEGNEGGAAAEGKGSDDYEDEEKEEEEVPEPTAFERAEEALRTLLREKLTASGAASGGGAYWAVTPAAALSLPPKLLARAVRHELLRPEHRNRGWVLDGFPTSVAEATVLFQAGEEDEEEDWEALGEVSTPRGKAKGKVPLQDEEDDEETPVVEMDAALRPRALLVVQAAEGTRAARLAALSAEAVEGGYSDAEGYENRCAAFAAHNKDDGARSIPAFLEANADLEALLVDGEADTPTQAVEPVLPAVDGAARPYNFHPTPEELAAKAASATQLAVGAADTKAAAAAALATDHAAEVTHRNAERSARMAAVARHERDLLELRSVPLKDYLVQTVLPTLTQGLAEVCQVQPSDPITHLAQFLYAASQEEEEKESAM